ncbi:MAG TPA: NAD+ synthase [Solirubrobacteraceae bacterium]
MERPLRLALHQLNTCVGDLAGNAAKIKDGLRAAREAGAQLSLFPELAITGYPPEDLLLKEHFLRDARAALDDVAGEARDLVAVVGFPERADDVYNAAAVLADGRVQAIYRKVRLPNYGVFDEVRYFQAGRRGALIEVDGVTVGLTVCEDIWVPGSPLLEEALAGADLVVNISASPYDKGKGPRRERMIVQRARDNLCAVAFCALVGGQDELVFDGQSCVVDHEGGVLARAPQFAEHLLVATVDPGAAQAARLRDTRQRPAIREMEPQVDHLGAFTTAHGGETKRIAGEVAELLDPDTEVYAALVLGTRDYVAKNGFGHVVLGLSGGIDSTLVLCVAVDALGADRVTAVTMPSRYSSEGTRSDAATLAANLGVELLELPIEDPMRAYDELLAEPFAEREPDITEENLQARIRGNLLMALSNKFGWLVLTTGNKSEMSVGYSTLYGDSAGGFAVIKDVPKLLVYRLVEVRARRDPESPIPQTIVTRPPSAELRPDQRDEDSLPPYDVLDAIVEGYVELDLGREGLLARGFAAEDVDRIIRLVDLAEYKRRQQPPGVKITTKAFGRDRRMPITNRYRG